MPPFVPSARVTSCLPLLPAGEAGLIPHVHEYCDRWCDRCPARSACEVFYSAGSGPERSPGPAAAAGASLTYWATWSEPAARRPGAGGDLAGALNLPRRDPRELQELVGLARAYREAARQVLLCVPPVLEAVEQALLERPMIEAAASLATSASWREAWEVAEWYVLFIEIKLQRALTSWVEDAVSPQDPGRRDADGSAKVALVAIDQSIRAWITLRHLLPDRGDHILDLLVALQRLRRRVEQVLPEARGFVRPGLD